MLGIITLRTLRRVAVTRISTPVRLVTLFVKYSSSCNTAAAFDLPPPPPPPRYDDYGDTATGRRPRRCGRGGRVHSERNQCKRVRMRQKSPGRTGRAAAFLGIQVAWRRPIGRIQRRLKDAATAAAAAIS